MNPYLAGGLIVSAAAVLALGIFPEPLISSVLLSAKTLP